MNQRPSTSSTPTAESRSGETPSLASRLTARRSSSIRRGLLVFLGVAPVLFIGGGTWLGLRFLQKSMAGDENARITNAASLSKQLVDRVLAERSRQVQLIASSPSVIAAAQRGGSVSRERGLQNKALADLETMFKATRSQQVDAAARSFLADLETKLDIAEVLVTDQYGYNAVTTAPSNDFVQSDEGWWKAAWNTGATSAQAKYDSATQSTVVELASMLRDRGSKVGVVKVKFGLSVVDSVLAQGSVGEHALRVDLVDSTGQVIASSAGVDRFRPFGAFSTVEAQEDGNVFIFTADSIEQRGAVALTNGGRWRIVAHMSDADAGRAYFIAKWVLVAAVIAILALVALSLFFVSRFIEKRITGPAAQLARVAQAVADGDLSKEVTHAHTDDEIGRLAHAIAGMISELRRLAAVLNETTEETGKMTAEITASSEEMAASAGQIAHTAADLSHQSTVMAETIHGLAEASEQLVSTASDLDDGAREGTERNSRLRALAAENRARLDQSSTSLAALSADAQAGAAAIDQLVEASEEIRSFVTLVQKLARQSKLLALNAAMEAARAGDHGHGFAVVAEEMRRLSAMSSDAAERTERVVSGVLKGVAESRATSARTLDTVRSVHSATEQGSRSFGNIEQAVLEADEWASAIQSTVTSASGLARDLRAKLDSLATGTESFAAAMQEVAASSEEQSASTEQIAAAASVLSTAADRLSRVVSNLRIESTTSTFAAVPIPPNAHVPVSSLNPPPPPRKETPSHGSMSVPPSMRKTPHSPHSAVVSRQNH
jgi:methyl-accepting chemotaxis protein